MMADSMAWKETVAAAERHFRESMQDCTSSVIGMGEVRQWCEKAIAELPTNSNDGVAHPVKQRIWMTIRSITSKSREIATLHASM